MNLDAVYKLELCPRRKIDPSKYPDVKSWVAKAIAEEDQKPNSILWNGEPTEDDQIVERLRRIRLCRKHENEYPSLKAIAGRLEWCAKKARCCSGVCPECGRLLQRWFVRKSKGFIANIVDKADQQLVAISIIPSQPIVLPGQLEKFSLFNFQQRLNYAIDKIGLGTAIGGVDFSYNEDRGGKYDPFWCVHIYLITSVGNKDRAKRELKKIYKRDNRIPRPVKVVDFNNSAWRRSYAYKTRFIRRIGYAATMIKNGVCRKCRNTSRDKLRVEGRLELFVHLDQVGLAHRLIFRGAKPAVSRSSVKIKAWPSYQANTKKCRKMAKNALRKGSFDET